MGRPELTRLYAEALRIAGRKAAKWTVNCFLAGSERIVRVDRMSAVEDFRRYFAECPLVAIIRGVTPGEAEAIGERDLRSRHPDHRSTAQFAASRSTASESSPTGSAAGRWSAPGRCSTQTTWRESRRPGGRLIVSPNTNVAVIEASGRRRDWSPRPAISRRPRRSPRSARAPTALKLFPAEAASPAVVKAQRAVLPKDVPMHRRRRCHAGQSFAGWLDAGADGFGLGGGLYKPGRMPRRRSKRRAPMSRR